MFVAPIAGQADSAAAQTPPAVRSILVFGDSLSAGYGLDKGEEWPALLQRRLDNDNNFTVKIHNHSVSGETTGGGLSRLRASLRQTRPDIVVLALGANDGLRGLSPAAMRANLQRMITMAGGQNAAVMLVGIHIPVNYGRQYRELFHRQFIELAAHNNLAFLPFLLEGVVDLSLYQSDGLHPVAAAQPRIMENVRSVLSPMLAAIK